MNKVLSLIYKRSPSIRVLTRIMTIDNYKLCEFARKISIVELFTVNWYVCRYY